MTNKIESIIRAIEKQLLMPPKNLEILPIDILNSMSSKIEDVADSSILHLYDKSNKRELLAKVKYACFVKNVGIAMNYFDTEMFAKAYNKGYGIFYIRDSYRREKYVYEQMDRELAEFLPLYYGGVESETRCIHLMEFLTIQQDPVELEQVATFCAHLHKRYLNNIADAMAMSVNIVTMDDYKNAVPLSHMLLDCVACILPMFPKNIVYSLHGFIDDYEKNYNTLITHPQTVCHGDLCVKNMTFFNRKLTVYDWELATFNNVEFDLISFLVHYPVALTQPIVESFIHSYLDNMHDVFPKSLAEFYHMMQFNLHLYMTTRFHAMIAISQKVDMPYMAVSIGNWLFLYGYFCK